MTVHLAMLPTDWLLYALVVLISVVLWRIRRIPHLRDPLRRLLKNKLGMVALTVMLCYIVVGLLDSVHFEVPITPGAKLMESRSILDMLVRSTASVDEQTYSAPFATQAFTTHQPLLISAARATTASLRTQDLIHRALVSSLGWLVLQLLLLSSWSWVMARRANLTMQTWWQQLWQGQLSVCWREVLITFGLITWIMFILANWYQAYHIMGTDKVGHDVFYASIKSIRTGLTIGTLTSLFVLPFALVLGMVAGYFSGWLDDVIQYVYTTMSSIPGVLLISAMILVLQVYLDAHSYWFATLAQRADARLLVLCVVLGLTGWSGLCRLIRAETLKLRELDFVQAARVLGVGRWRILLRHILPNLFHLVIITAVLDFSGLVLAEAVLTYVGVGVDPTTYSWGNMINSSRLELARQPMVWWPLGGAMLFMFFLVLSANLLADAVRDALDPRLRSESR